MRIERTRLNRIEDQCLELLGQPGWPVEKLTERLDLVREQRAEIKERLGEIENRMTDTRTAGVRAASIAELLYQPRALFRQLPDDLRKTFVNLCFDRFQVDVVEPEPPWTDQQGSTTATVRSTALTTRDDMQLRLHGERRGSLDARAVTDLITAAAQTEPRAKSREQKRLRSVRDLLAYR